MKDLLVVALGPDQKEKLTLEAAEAIRSSDVVLLRTKRHGAAQWMEENQICYESFDSLHESADDFASFAISVAEAVQRRMRMGLAVCYAVAEPHTDETVLALLAAGVPMRVIEGVTHASAALALALSAHMPLSGGVCVIPAVDIQNSCLNPDIPLMITEIGSRLLAGDVKIALLSIYPPEMQLLFCGEVIALSELDRQKQYDHLSAALLPACPYEKRDRFVLSDLEKIMSRLRDPMNGCPWDVKQTHRTLREFLLEEAYEVIEAIDANDPPRVADELGDVLLQVAFHAQIAKEHAEFSLQDIITSICAKMIHRHTHIFSDARCDSPEDVLKNWEAVKQKEKGIKSGADSMLDIPSFMPSLQRAGKVLDKATRIGFRRREAAETLSCVKNKIARLEDAMLSGTDFENALGEILLDFVSVAKAHGVEPELSLKKATDRFIESFRQMEQWAEASGKRIELLTDEEFLQFMGKDQ